MATNTNSTRAHDNSNISPSIQAQRPPLHNHLSNSVPSTPYQQACDARYPQSRSPSPRRDLRGNHSPRSVVSEAIEPRITNGLPRLPTAPVVCKFETAPEWRKRRVPYVDGGDQELAPPEKRPRASLDSDEEDKLSGDMRELYDRLLPSDESEERRALLVKKLERILNEEWPDNDIKVSVFGSSGNLLSSSYSDVDICLTTSLKRVESMHNLAMLLHKNGMERVVCRAAAKVPIVKCWDPELQLACDVNVNNPLALENTRMIKTYVQLDPRVRPLAKIVKHWTQERKLNDAAFGGTISSYTWICMVISFLQQREPPILPSLQKIQHPRSTVEGETSQFADDVATLEGCGKTNTESLANLLFHFFRYYGYDFEYSKYVVSVKEGRKLSRKEKGWDNPRDNKEARCRLCVEEPFNTSRNLGNSADDYAWSGIHEEIRRAFDLLAKGESLSACCEQYVFPPEEKSTFQRPAPKPKPTLTRSASQSGARPSHDTHTTRSRKGSNRNQSTHRNGSRRASSGAVFGVPQIPMLRHSPQIGLASVDYFAKQGNLHDQLYQQYQYLQAQQDALKTQLAMREQQQQAQGSSTGTSTPHLRQHAGFVNGRLFDNAPQTAPLLPGSLYHFTARYPQVPKQPQRTRDGSITGPPSPALSSSMPIPRQDNRTTTSEGSNATVRSQSQPGRSLPHPITLQQQVHPGYDVSGALSPAYQVARASQYYNQHMHFGYPYPIALNDAAAPKEYVGYYVGAMPVLNGVPQRQRRVTPDLHPPIVDGSVTSRSPSPLDPLRNLAAVRRTSPVIFSEPGEPLIVNGSTPLVKVRDRTNGCIPQPLTHSDNALGLDIPIIAHSLPVRNEKVADVEKAGSSKSVSRTSPHLSLSPSNTSPDSNDTATISHDVLSSVTAPLLSPVAELRTPSPTLSHRLESSDWPQHLNGIDKQAKVTNGRHGGEQKLSLLQAESKSTGEQKSSRLQAETKPAGEQKASLLPTQSTSTEEQKSSLLQTEPKPAGEQKVSLLQAESKPAGQQKVSLLQAELNSVPDIKKDSKPNAPSIDVAKEAQQKSVPAAPLPARVVVRDQNPWQQAVSRKGHKKNKSLANAATVQRSPIIEAERKGG